MSARRLRFSGRAEEDLDNLWYWIARDSVTNADRYVQKIRDKCKVLVRFPGFGRPYPHSPPPETRLFPVDDYLVLYEVHPDEVMIIHIVHGAMDLPRLLERRQ